MFGFFKKRDPKPSKAVQFVTRFQRGFATQWVRNCLVDSVGGFSGAALCGEGAKLISNGWRTTWTSNFPELPMVEPDGLTVDQSENSGYLIVFIAFPFPDLVGGAYFGVAVIGPCADPSWSPESRRNLPFRYFVLFHETSGTSVEEWTTDPPTAFGAGPEPERIPFTEYVLNYAIRPSHDKIFSVRSSDAEMASAIERARRELPAVLKRFISGELHDTLFTVKVVIKDSNYNEHIWLSDTTYSDGRFCGVIDAVPSITRIKRGDRWTAPIEEVTDWKYVRNGKLYGGYTLRALLPSMPPEEAAKWRAVLAEEGG